MVWLASATVATIATVATVASVGATLYSAYQQGEAADRTAGQLRSQGKAQRDADYFEAAQLEQNAGQDVAASQRNAQNAQRQSQIIQSRALAVAGASGASPSDPSIAKIMADLAKEGQLAVESHLYQGNESARQGALQAKVKRYQGDQAEAGLAVSASSALATGRANVTTTLLSGASNVLGSVAKIKG